MAERNKKSVSAFTSESLRVSQDEKDLAVNLGEAMAEAARESMVNLLSEVLTNGIKGHAGVKGAGNALNAAPSVPDFIALNRKAGRKLKGIAVFQNVHHLIDRGAIILRQPSHPVVHTRLLAFGNFYGAQWW